MFLALSHEIIKVLSKDGAGYDTVWRGMVEWFPANAPGTKSAPLALTTINLKFVSSEGHLVNAYGALLVPGALG